MWTYFECIDSESGVASYINVGPYNISHKTSKDARIGAFKKEIVGLC